MQIIADLQLHSRFARAVSKEMNFPNMYAWARRKGIDVLATGDWTHPMWMREIERDLVETGNGLLRLKTQDLRLKTPFFMLATEVSCIYSQGGKVRRVHTLIWVPTIESARKISQEMTRRGCNLMSDGRPIIGLTSIQVAELVLSIEPKALIIPAHCLVPESMVLTDGFFPKQIQYVTQGERVYTHTGGFEKVTEVKKRAYSGDVITIKPWYFRPGLTTTPEHPYWAIQTLKKCPSTGDICRPSKAHLSLCRDKACLLYEPAWILAKNLKVGDVLVYPRPKRTRVCTEIHLSCDLKGFSFNGSIVSAGGTRGRSVSDALPVTEEFGRLLGYYIAEGSTDGKNSFSFAFSNDEAVYIDDLLNLMKTVFGLGKPRIYRRAGTKGVEIGFSSKIHAAWLAAVCYHHPTQRNAAGKKLPGFLFEAEDRVQAECLRGWFRGDHGYTTSRVLVNQMKTVCLRLGIIPSILVNSVADHQRRGNHKIGNRTIEANYDLYSISNFSFFEDACDLKKEMPRSQTKLERKHGWIDKTNVYIPIKEIITKEYEGDVYNFEVENDHSYVTEFAAVHNCWTPWFSVFGSLGGFDSIEEAFGPYAKEIYAVETGLSSNPSMNWRIKELDNRAILSFSDAHSLPKLGREATVFELEAVNYDAIYQAIVQPNTNRIAYTIEFYPEEGKYHYTGHRACNIRYTPEETAKKGTTCPVCGKALTIGVMERVEALAGRSEKDLQLEETIETVKMIRSTTFPNRPPFVMLVPLQEILSECIGSPVQSPKVQGPYGMLVSALGGEFFVLLRASLSDIAKIAGDRVAAGIKKVRIGDLHIDPGYDGVFGVVKLWREGEKKPLVDSSKEQLTLL